MSEAHAAHPILPAGQTYADVTDQLAGILLHLPSRRIRLIALLISSALLGLLFVSATHSPAESRRHRGNTAA